MLPVKKSNLIPDSIALVNEILVEHSDRFETGLSRTAKRIIGFLVGSTAANSGIFGLFGLDTDTDAKKIKIIQTRMDQLDLIESSSEKETKAIQFQKQICENVKNYTKNAKIIKTITAISALAVLLLYVGYGIRAIDSPVLQKEKISQKPMVAFYSLTTVGGMLACFVHWLVAGSDLYNEKKALAHEAQEQLKD